MKHLTPIPAVPSRLRKPGASVRFLLLIVLAFWSEVVNGQDLVVKGKVTDATEGASLPGVNVQIKGTAIGTITDVEGNYSISITGSDPALIFSFVGMKTHEEVVGQRGVIDVGMEQDVKLLSEIVVTGVGVSSDQRKVSIEVSSLKSKDMVSSAVGSIDQAIQGKIAGAQVLINSGEPGTAAYIQLRGINSLGSSQPIILMDGVQITTLTGLDMTNIDHIEVVKGAAAGMLYGAQGANGVIQIFTKRGQSDRKMSVIISSKYIIDEALKPNDPLIASGHAFDTDAQGFILNTVGGRIAPDSITGTWTEPAINITPDLKNEKAYKERTIDHYAQAYRTARSQNTTVNISGGGERYDYSLNVNWLNQESVRFNDLKRKNIALNLGVVLAKGLTVRSITQLTIQNEALQSGSRFAIVNSYPWIDFNSTYGNGYKVIKPELNGGYNPLSEYEWYTRGTKSTRIIQNFNLRYEFPRFVILDYKYGVQFGNANGSEVYRNQQGFLQPPDAYWGPPPGTGSVYQDNTNSVYQNSLLSVFVNADFTKDFNINLPISTTTHLTYDWRKDESSQFWAQATGFPFPPYNLNIGANKTAGSYEYNFITYGYLINQTINYGNIGGISAGLRADYSSEFGFNQNGAKVEPFVFPRGTAFFSPSQFFKSNLVANWKIRAAYGEAGIQPGQYARQSVYSTATYASAAALFIPFIIGNENLKVQRTKELELGTDLVLSPGLSNKWLRKIDLTLSYWKRRSQDIIQNAQTSPSAGITGIIDNQMSLTSEGVDISLGVQAYNSKKFDWNLGMRLGKAVTMVDKISSGLDVPYGMFMIKENEPLGVFYGQVVLSSLSEKRPDGTDYIPEAQQNNYEVIGTRYGPVVVDKTTHEAVISDANDKRMIGNPQPDYFGSVINDFTLFRNFQVNMQWDFSVGGKIYHQTRQWLYRDRLSKDFDYPVTINGESGAWVSFYNSLYNSVIPLSWFVEDGSYARLRNLSISYHLPINAGWARQVTFSLIGRNLVTIMSYHGTDPESVTTGVVDRTGNTYGNFGPIRGIDSFNFPNLKSYQIGVTIEF